MHQSVDLHVKTSGQGGRCDVFIDFLHGSEGAGALFGLLEGGAGGGGPFATLFSSKGPTRVHVAAPFVDS